MKENIPNQKHLSVFTRFDSCIFDLFALRKTENDQKVMSCCLLSFPLLEPVTTRVIIRVRSWIARQTVESESSGVRPASNEKTNKSLKALKTHLTARPSNTAK